MKNTRVDYVVLEFEASDWLFLIVVDWLFPHRVNYAESIFHRFGSSMGCIHSTPSNSESPSLINNHYP